MGAIISVEAESGSIVNESPLSENKKNPDTCQGFLFSYERQH
jgi:hypothetical protein